MSLERSVLEHDGDSSLRFLEVPRMEKRNKCLENEISYDLSQITCNFQFISYLVYL